MDIVLMKDLMFSLTIAITFKLILYFVYHQTISVKDKIMMKRVLETDVGLVASEVAKHTRIIAMAIYVTGLFIFCNSAILMSMVVRSVL
jgi:hypothetical protein